MVDEYFEGIMNRGEKEMGNSNIKDVPHPICPLNLYFEGDEDKCDTSKCDFKNRSCTFACKIDVKELPKEFSNSKPEKTKDKKSPNNYSRGKAVAEAWGNPAVDPSWIIRIGDIIRFQTIGVGDGANAKEFVHRWNSFLDEQIG